MSKVRVLIVDDERLARNRMKRLLAHFEWVEVVGEADSVLNARSVVHGNEPDIVFLDVQMPGGTGFELLPHLPLLAPVTATLHKQDTKQR